ncbi:hypothetical protein CEUSTIGMA_g5662.t1 [Chlamydomonas eustigma]|uniref:VASt domain-containing protein n=1 Tax=Chlamydomonas eustigma TaxID=1157962 RepID=A0A250X630_9CHLO|nr:hypothetical protein CEUSTIGMA_g5662.t1 [Chlamydomonas eustigma]|eukprot:GAX78220.1 hypothetical protein CEUSTIGMA_g5662.t1 [Chlamydomonas eustigma]
MVKKIDLQTVIHGCTAQQFFDVVYGSADPMTKYHLVVNKDPAAEVSPWDQGTRSVNFQMPLNIPDFLKKAFGVESVKVQEKQSVVWHSGENFTVTSETVVLNVPGASRFTTTLYLTVLEQNKVSVLAAASAAAAAAAAAVMAGTTDSSDSKTCNNQQMMEEAQALGVAAGSGVEIVFTVRCGAGLPWPMSSSVENIMAEKAQISMAGFLDFCCQLIDQSNPPSGVPPASVAGPASPSAFTRRLSTLTSMRRWPAAIASTSAYDQDNDLEAPLLFSRASSDFQDANEAFVSPGSMSGTATPNRLQAGSMAAADFQAVLDGGTGAPPGSSDAFRSALQSQLQSAASLKPGSRSSEVHQVICVLNSLTQAVQGLDANVTSLIKRLDAAVPSSSQQSPELRNDPGRYRSTAMATAPQGRSTLSRYVLTVVVLVFVLFIFLGLYFHFWHQTGLRPEPPSDLGTLVTDEEAVREALADRAAFVSGW